MSNIIDEAFIISHQSQNSSHQSFQEKKEFVIQQFTSNNQEILRNFIKFLSNTSSDYVIDKITDTSKEYINFKLVFCNVGLKNLNAMLSVNINSKLRFIQTSVKFLDGQKLFKIQTIDQRITACKLFSKSSHIKNFNKISISIFDGVFKIIRPVVFSFQNDFSDIFQTKNKDWSLNSIIRNAIKEAIQASKPILRQVAPFIVQNPSSSTKRIQDFFSKAIYRYIIRSPIQPAFDVSFGSGKYDIMEYLTKQQIFNTNLMIKNIVTDFSQFQTHHLYLTPNVSLQSLKKLYVKQYFSSNDEELNSLKEKAMPPPNRVNINNESKYVYNTIQLNQNIPINLKRINMGGFSEISKAQAEFWYLLSVSNRKMAKIDEGKKQPQQQQQKEVKLKKQNKKWLVFKTNNYKGTQSGRNRIAHQMKVLSKFKGATSLFMPEYFKVTNQKSPFSQYLVMQFFPYPTLNEYFQQNKMSMSFLTKIHLASLIIQGLRFIKTYQITHMDLKPSNIIVSKRLIIKLIDFGEAFNKQVCQKNFKPAFSMPYGCPEVFDTGGKLQFSQNNDVYSWGVIFFQLLFKRLPFIFSRQQASKIFKERSYMNYMFFVPEQQQKYGSWEMMPLLTNIIFRALGKDFKNRPRTIWLTVVLKQCLNYFINLQLNPSSS